MARSEDPTDHFKELTTFTVVIKSHLVCEKYISSALCGLAHKADFLDIDRFSFSEKVRIAAAFGIIPDDYVEAVRHLNIIRNKVVHDLDYDLTLKDFTNFRDLFPRKALERVNLLDELPTEGNLHIKFFALCICLMGTLEARRDIYVELRSVLSDQEYALMQHILGGHSAEGQEEK